MAEKPLVLVTGGTGFLAGWIIVLLFRQGYRVRTTVRTLSRAAAIKSSLHAAGGITESQISSLEVVETNLLQDDGWAEAVKDATYVLHIASPFPAALPKHEDDLIIPAREGTLRVLKAARDSGCVTRVVITSSFAAVGYGHPKERSESGVPYTEKDWTDLGPGNTVQPYNKSKTLAERAAWDFMKNLETQGSSKLELAVICPTVILGPALGKDDASSLKTVGELLSGALPGSPKLQFGVVDVRDCADMHLRAMTEPKAKGERFICVGEGSIWLEDIAKILKKNLGSKARKVPTMVLPNILMRGVALFLPVARLILGDLGVVKEISNAKAREVLGWKWQYSNEQAVMASADSLIKFGMVNV